jgi:hypothetical protein
MKQTIRENRRGKVRVAEHLFLDGSPEVALLRSCMEVCECLPDYRTATRWFIGYAPEFDALELGAQPPEYEAIFTCDDRGPPLGVLFRRRAEEDRRIAEFKEASDEWLRRISAYALSLQG